MDFESILGPLGSPLEDYQGTGILEMADGDVIECRFHARQTTAGEILLLLARDDAHSGFPFFFGGPAIEGFRGTTENGIEIELRGQILPRNLPPGQVKGAKSWVSVTATKMSARHNDKSVSEIRFGLTNLRLPQPWTLTLELDGGAGPEQARLRRLDDGRIRYKSARATRGVEVTAELIFESQNPDIAKQVAEDICYLLSIAQGSVVSWVYLDERAIDSLVRRQHHHRRTREFAPFPAVETSGPQWPVEFIEATYSTYVMRRDDWQLDRGPVDWYLESKIEADYLEARAAKLAVALETLEHRYLHSSESSISPFILPRGEFKEVASVLVSEINGFLKHRGIEEPDRSKIAGQARGMNRQSFRSTAKSLLSLLDITLETHEMDQFLDSRNCLVHQGQFYCKAVEKDEANGRSEPLPSVNDEYFFMVTVLDRIFLRLVGYEGDHRDWTVFPERKFIPVQR